MASIGLFFAISLMTSWTTYLSWKPASLGFISTWWALDNIANSISSVLVPVWRAKIATQGSRQIHSKPKFNKSEDIETGSMNIHIQLPPTGRETSKLWYFFIMVLWPSKSHKRGFLIYIVVSYLTLVPSPISSTINAHSISLSIRHIIWNLLVSLMRKRMGLSNDRTYINFPCLVLQLNLQQKFFKNTHTQK